MDSIVVGARWDGRVWLSEAHQDKDPAGLTPERVLEEIGEALFVDGPLKGRLCLALTIDVVKHGSRIAAGSQVSVASMVRAVRIDQDNAVSGEVIRFGIAVRTPPGAMQPKVAQALLTGTLEVQCCESVQAGPGSHSWQATHG